MSLLLSVPTITSHAEASFLSLLVCLPSLLCLFPFFFFSFPLSSFLSVHLDYLKDMQNHCTEHLTIYEKEMGIYLPSVWCYAITALLRGTASYIYLHQVQAGKSQSPQISSRKKIIVTVFSSLTSSQNTGVKDKKCP